MKHTRIGPRMVEAQRIVARNPGILPVRVAERVGPYGSRQYGYRTVKRALQAQLIRYGWGCPDECVVKPIHGHLYTGEYVAMPITVYGAAESGRNTYPDGGYDYMT